MLASVYSAGLIGLNAYLFSVQVDESNGLPRSLIVGNVSPSVREALDRAEIALKNNGVELPPKKITINIQPADIRKGGTSFDFAILVGMLLATQEPEDFPYANYAFLGELGLDGEIKHIPGVLPMVMAMKEAGIEGVFVGKEDEKEAKNCENIKVLALSSIEEFIRLLPEKSISKTSRLKTRKNKVERIDSGFGNQGENVLKKKITIGLQIAGRKGNTKGKDLDFSDVVGQKAGIRACLIAASGKHALLFSGPAGAGKSMLAKRIPSILPKLNKEEKLEVSKIYSIAGNLSQEYGMIEKRPFRAPHSAISQNTLLGGMVHGNLVPGELALATKGVLFLDELPLFKKETVEALRSPLEEGKVVLHRLQQVFSYDVDCLLVLAMNPCPCGFFPDRNRCNCSPGQVRTYQRGLSKPILERIDMSMELPPVSIEDAMGKDGELCSEDLRKSVEKTIKIQKARFKDEEKIEWNSQMGVAELEKYCCLGKEEREFMKKIFAIKKLSMRTYHKILKVARTIADLDGEEQIGISHLSEAVSYRTLEDKLY